MNKSLLLTLSISALISFSCKKNLIDEKNNDCLLIQTTYNEQPSNEKEYTYAYDDQKRIISRISKIAGTKLISTFTYTANEIKETEQYYSDGLQSGTRTYVYNINKEGRIDFMNVKGLEYKALTTYTYDNDGYLIQTSYSEDENIKSVIKFINKGNTITTTHQDGTSFVFTLSDKKVSENYIFPEVFDGNNPRFGVLRKYFGKKIDHLISSFNAKDDPNSIIYAYGFDSNSNVISFGYKANGPGNHVIKSFSYNCN